MIGNLWQLPSLRQGQAGQWLYSSVYQLKAVGGKAGHAFKIAGCWHDKTDSALGSGRGRQCPAVMARPRLQESDIGMCRMIWAFA